MRAPLGLVKVDIHPQIENQRQDENHMGDDTPSRNPTHGRAQPKSLPYYIRCKVRKLALKSQALSPVTSWQITPRSLRLSFGEVDPTKWNQFRLSACSEL